MKNLTSIVVIFMMLLSLFPAANAEDVTYTEGTLYYTINDGSITITGCFGRNETVEIPSQIAGIPVNTIAAGAFTNNPSVKTVKVPDTVTTIEYGAIGDGITVVFSGGNVYLIGDANEDGTVDAKDCGIIRRYAVGLADLTSRQITLADVNGDGKINVIDVNYVRRYVAQMISEFPVS